MIVYYIRRKGTLIYTEWGRVNQHRGHFAFARPFTDLKHVRSHFRQWSQRNTRFSEQFEVVQFEVSETAEVNEINIVDSGYNSLNND